MLNMVLREESNDKDTLSLSKWDEASIDRLKMPMEEAHLLVLIVMHVWLM